MQRGFSDTDGDTKTLIVEAVQRVLHDLREECGLEAFLAFGCLLGAVRNGHMIGHDSDADLAYVSTHTHPFDIIRENHAAARRMKQLGWQIVRMSEADFKVWVDLADGRRCGIDVFGGYFVDDVFYLMPNVSGAIDRSALVPVAPITLEGLELLGPARPEELLALTYGEGWKVPDPSFKFTPLTSTVRRTNGWMRGRRTNLRHWHDFYKPEASRDLPTEASDFAHWVGERIEPGSRVVDVGTGNGRDALWFAERGHPVTALDATVNGMRRLRTRAARDEAPGGPPDGELQRDPDAAGGRRRAGPAARGAAPARPVPPRRAQRPGPAGVLALRGRDAAHRRPHVPGVPHAGLARRGARRTPPTSASTSTRTRWSPRSSSTAAPWSSARRAAASPCCGDEDPDVCRLVVQWGGRRRPAPPRAEPADVREPGHRPGARGAADPRPAPARPRRARAGHRGAGAGERPRRPAAGRGAGAPAPAAAGQPRPALIPQCGLDACRWAMPHPAAVRRQTSVIRNGEFTSPPPRRAVSWPSATTQPTSPTS